MVRSKLLAKELETYKQHRNDLLEHHAGKFVLIHDSEVVSVFESEREAINEGYERFGNVPMLVKQIVEVEVPLRMISHPIGG
jgi:hypothetical protein